MEIGITRIEGPHTEVVDYLSDHSAMKITQILRTGSGVLTLWTEATKHTFSYDVNGEGVSIIISAADANSIIPGATELYINGVLTGHSWHPDIRTITVSSDNGWSAGDNLEFRVQKSSHNVTHTPPKDVYNLGVNNGDVIVIPSGVVATFEYSDLSHNHNSRHHYEKFRP